MTCIDIAIVCRCKDCWILSQVKEQTVETVSDEWMAQYFKALIPGRSIGALPSCPIQSRNDREFLLSSTCYFLQGVVGLHSLTELLVECTVRNVAEIEILQLRIGSECTGYEAVHRLHSGSDNRPLSSL